MKTFFKGITISTKVVFIIALSLASLFIYIFVAYLVAGHEVISSGALGSDAWSFISRMKLLSDNFPKYPFWNPWEGGGVSLLYGYPPGIHTLIIVTSKLLDWTLVEALKFWEFASVVIFAFGVFIYTWVRFRITVVSFLAGLFFILSPIAWMWMFEWGFVAEQIAVMFFPFTILFFDLFLLQAIEGNWSLKTRLYLFLTVILLGLSALSHPFVFTGVLSFALVYGIIVSLLRKKAKLKSIVKVIAVTFGFLALMVLLFGFWLIPFYNYTGLANSSSGQTSRPPMLSDYQERDELSFTHIFSIKPPRILDKNEFFSQNKTLPEGYLVDGQAVLEKGYIWRNLSFPLAVSILYFLGMITSFVLLKRKLPHALVVTFILVLFSVSTLVIFIFQTISYYVSQIPILGTPAASIIGWLGSWRGNIFAARLFVPVGAAYGAYGVFALILYPFKFLEKRAILRWSKNIILSIFALLLASFVLYYFRSKPALPFGYLAYGKEVSFPGRAIYLRNIWRNTERADDRCMLWENRKKAICNKEKFLKNFDASKVIFACSENPYEPVCDGNFSDQDIDRWVKECDGGIAQPPVSEVLCSARSDMYEVLAGDLKKEIIFQKLESFSQKEFNLGDALQVFATIPNDDFIRYDTSPHRAFYSQIGPYVKKTPQMPVYINSSSLVHRMWGYQISNFYADDPVYPDPASLPEIAQWFGIKYLISHPSDPLDKFESAGFKRVGDSQIFEYSEAEFLAALSKKPTILVIGDTQKGVYELVFRRANFGFISYDEAMLVDGGEFVDLYSLDELKRFDVVFLYGYKYKNKSRAWRMLDEYVRDGGRLYIDTGWQFTSADWEVGETADFFPTTELSWTNFGITSDYSLHEGLINTEDVDTGGFEALIWNDQPWGVSSGDQLRSWAKPILTVQDNPLVAGGQYGKGKVVWSGMNLLGHIKVFDSSDPETIFASRLIDWLLEGFQVQNFVFRQDFDAKRPNPDRVEFTFKTSIDGPLSLYFKEATHPFWKTEIISGGGGREELDIQKAGPGFMLISLRDLQAGDRINLYIQKPLKHYVYDIVSLLALFGLLAFVVYPKPFRIKLQTKFKYKFLKEKQGLLSTEEEDY